MKQFRNWNYYLLGTLMTVYFVVLGRLSVLRHNAFASGFDLGNMDSTVWNTIHGHIFQLSEGGHLISRFSIHADLILVVLSPLYFIWDNVRILILSESFFLALGAIPLYLIGQKLLKSKILAFVPVILYLLNPGMQWTDIYDFHGVSLAIPFLLFTFYFAFTKRWRWYGVFLLLALLTKEQISLGIVSMGVFIALYQKEWRKGFLTSILGIIWFAGMVFVIIPHFSIAGKHWALSWYQTAGQVVPSSIPSIGNLLHSYVFTVDAMGYYKSLVEPFALLPILGLPVLAIALPELAVNLLSSHAQMRSIVLHYDSGITPWLAVSTVFGLYYLQSFLNKSPRVRHHGVKIVTMVSIIAIFLSVRDNYHYSPLPTTPACWCFMYQPSKDDIAFERLLQQIPKDASVTASPEIRPHMTHREMSYTLPSATSSADFIALIDQNRILGNYDPKEYELVLQKQLETSNKYSLVKHIGHFYLYRRNGYVMK